jgi:hypothetical protein
MKPVFMDNDVGGIVYVGKNELCLLFANGITHTIVVNTKDLLEYLETKSPEELEDEKFLIEPFFHDLNGAVMTIITAKQSVQDDDKATVFRGDLVDALRSVEILPV